LRFALGITGRVRAPRPARCIILGSKTHREHVKMKKNEPKKTKPNIINIVASGTDWIIKTKNSTLKGKPQPPKDMGGES
jgi:rRNA pseudouridine-1189 N-methylase Emg1 (Nep1/Mra1 family)